MNKKVYRVGKKGEVGCCSSNTASCALQACAQGLLVSIEHFQGWACFAFFFGRWAWTVACLPVLLTCLGLAMPHRPAGCCSTFGACLPE